MGMIVRKGNLYGGGSGDNSVEISYEDFLKLSEEEKAKDITYFISDYPGTVDPAEIVDNLDSTDTDKALSANMGRELKENIDNINTVEVVDSLDSTDTDKALSANMGRELKEELSEFFKARGVVCEKNTTDWTENSSRVTRSGNTICVYVNVIGVPVNQKTILTGLPKPLAALYAYSPTATPSKIALGNDGTLLVVSSGTSSSVPIVFEMTYQSND